jgi:hypothetical protein
MIIDLNFQYVTNQIVQEQEVFAQEIINVYV